MKSMLVIDFESFYLKNGYAVIIRAWFELSTNKTIQSNIQYQIQCIIW